MELTLKKTRPTETEDCSAEWLQFCKEIIIHVSPALDILYLNAKAKKLFENKLETSQVLIGENFNTLCASIGLKSPLPNDLSNIPTDHPFPEIETDTQNGHLILSWSIVRTLDTQDKPNGILLIATDMSALRKTEHLLQDAYEDATGTNTELARFSTLVVGQDSGNKKVALEYAKYIYDYMENIVVAMPGSVYWMNKEGIYLGCNDNMAALFNLKSRHEIVGKTYKDIYDEKSGDYYQAIDAEVMKSGIPKNLEEPLYSPDGTKSIWLSSKTPLRDPAGQVIGMLGISLNITERKNAEELLKEAKQRAVAANLAKSEFLAVINHELRIPLTSILGINQLLSTQNFSPEKQKEYLNHISTAGMHLLNLINDTLDFAKLEAGQFELTLAPMDLRSLIEETITMLTPLAKAKNLELFVHYDQDIPHHIFSDNRALRQIIINLLGNAIKFTEMGYASIQIECIKKTDKMATLVISVNDTGIGIPEDKQGIIFDHFTQADTSHSRKYGGAGLGLAITKQLVELMNGTIGVTSQVGLGTTFQCVIKFLLQKDTLTDSPWMKYQSFIRVLIVDDTSRGKIIKKQLKTSNCQVVSGKEAFTTFLASYQLSDPYHIVIIDQKLFSIDPFELAAQICQHHKSSPPLLILLSEDGSMHAKETAKEAGFFDCFIKPIQSLALQIALTATWENWIEQREVKKPSLPPSYVPIHGSEHTPYKKNNLRVLLVEDDAIIQIVHTNYLQQLVQTLDVAGNGKEALEKLNNEYDLIFMDMGLPDVHGIDVIKEFRKKNTIKEHTPIVALTGYSTESNLEEFLQSGADDVLIKPVFLDELEKTIRKYCKAPALIEQD